MRHVGTAHLYPDSTKTCRIVEADTFTLLAMGPGFNRVSFAPLADCRRRDRQNGGLHRNRTGSMSFRCPGPSLSGGWSQCSARPLLRAPFRRRRNGVQRISCESPARAKPRRLAHGPSSAIVRDRVRDTGRPSKVPIAYQIFDLLRIDGVASLAPGSRSVELREVNPPGRTSVYRARKVCSVLFVESARSLSLTGVVP